MQFAFSLSAHAALMLEEAHGEATRAAEATLAAPVTVPERDRAELEAELPYLRTFSDVYRTHLQALPRRAAPQRRGLGACREDLPLRRPR
jgi:hypothetical protein